MINFIAADGTVLLHFAKTEALARTKSSNALRYAIVDCRGAIDAFPEGPKAGYYADEIHVYAAELRDRTNNILHRP